MSENFRHQRRIRGGTLALIAALSAAVIIAILLFALAYTRLLGSNQEQKTAIEAASIAAAKDAGRIVIEDNNFGYISLSDAAPVGQATKAADGFSLPVKSINTIMGTIRLDLIIADKLNNQVMKSFAKRDLQNLKIAKDKLILALEAALVPGGTGKDIDGNTVEPYKSAEDAYKTNQIRMTGNSRYVSGSLRLTLGSVTDTLQTNIPLPKPNSWAAVGSGQSQSGFYLAHVNCPFDGEDFVFAGISDKIKLVDTTKFAKTISSLPYQMPAIVRAEADQLFQEGNRVVHSIACACSASVFDPIPAPGSLSIAFPDGRHPAIDQPIDLLQWAKLTGSSPMTIESPSGTSDFPNSSGGSMSPGSWTGPGSATVSNVWSQVLYDWYRQSGTKLDAKSAIDMQNNALLTPGLPGPFTTGFMDIYQVDQTGLITQKMSLIAPDPFESVSNKQMYAELKAVDQTVVGKSGTPADWDVYIRDQVTQWGNPNGGIHAGQPLGNPAVALLPPSKSKMICHKPSFTQIGSTKWRVLAGEYGGSGNGASSGGSADASSGAGYGPGGVIPLNFGPRDDFGGATVPGPTVISFPSGTGMPGVYLQNGSAGSIRFRLAALNPTINTKFTKRKK